MKISEYTPGTFCWIELVTSDGDGAKKFYTDLFGLGFNDQPVGEDAVYTMLNKEGKNVAALYQMNEEQGSRGIYPHWNSYVSVKSADETTEKVKSLGGTVTMEPFDVFDAGRMAMFQDPTGASFAVWQPNQHIGAQLTNDPGTLCWNELTTNDTQKAGEFYTRLFGWTSNTDSGSPPYTMFMIGERPAGGMLEIQKEWGEVPPNWVVYFAVEDCDASAEKATSLGAKILSPPTDVPEIGRFAVIQDAQGAAFAIIKLENPGQ